MDREGLYEKLNSILEELKYGSLSQDDRIELVRVGKKTLLELDQECDLEILKAQQ